MGYDLQNLKGDLSGGLVAGIIALPLALAFGVQSGLGATAGLYGAIAVGIFAALLGGTITLASGPTGPMTVVSASIVVYAVESTGSVESGLGIVLLSFLMGGVFQISLGFLGIGRYIRYFPYPVVSGFMSGVGLIIIVLQIWPFFGNSSPKSTLEVFTRVAELLPVINWSAVLLGTITLLVYYLFPRITKAIPSVLVALLVGTLVARISGMNVPVIGNIPTGFPALRLGELFSVEPQYYSFILGSGLTLALLGSIDSLLTCVIVDNLTKKPHNSNRELMGQGIGNMVAAIFGGIPGAGTTSVTVVNINAGGKTRLSSVTHGLVQLIVLLGAGAVVAYVPLSVLAGLLISVGLAIIDYRGLKHLRYIPKADAAVMIVVLLWTVFGNLIHAVVVGIVLASILYMKKSADFQEADASLTSLSESLWADEIELKETFEDSIYIKHLNGPLFFGFTSGFKTLAAQVSEKKAKVLIIRMENVPYIDQSGLYALENAIFSLQPTNTPVLLIGLREQPRDMLERIQLIPSLVAEEQLFTNINECQEWLERKFPNS